MDRFRARIDDPAEIDVLFSAVAAFESRGVRFRLVRDTGLFGILALAGPPDLVGTSFTDTNPMVDDLPIPEVLPLRGADAASVNTAAAVKDYLLSAHAVLSAHPVNQGRVSRGLEPINALVTQRPGRLAPIESFTERHGLRGLTIASGVICPGLARYLGMDVHLCGDTDDPGADLAQRLTLAREALADHDFIHVHTKTPDEAAHTKSRRKSWTSSHPWTGHGPGHRPHPER
jgi:2,3-bisphosphoglycerate-independent phosphoglycerate mutase